MKIGGHQGCIGWNLTFGESQLRLGADLQDDGKQQRIGSDKDVFHDLAGLDPGESEIEALGSEREFLMLNS